MNKRKVVKISIIVILLFYLSFPSYFIYRSLSLPRYIIDGNKITYKDSVYIFNKDAVQNYNDNDGKMIGIAIYKDKKSSIFDLINGHSVKEYKDDKEHNRIIVTSFMGGGTIYDKVSK